MDNLNINLILYYLHLCTKTTMGKPEFCFATYETIGRDQLDLLDHEPRTMR